MTSPWLDWAVEIQSLAQNGLAYCKDKYDIERFERLRDIAAEMLAYQGDMPFQKVRALFCGETGYQTPKLDTRAAIIEGGRIALVREQSGLWAMPGGWVDARETIFSNTVKEAREESGLIVKPLRLIALHDRNKRNKSIYAYSIVKAFVLCQPLGGAFQPNLETTACAYFAPDELPPLAEEKTTREQIAMCFQAYRDPHWQVVFD